MFISREVQELFDGPWGNDVEQDRCARLRGDLEGFVKGQTIGVCMEPGKGRESHRMARLDPTGDGFWDVRSVDPSPGLRVLGGFIARDTFVALRWRPRSKPWRGRDPLLARNSEAWEQALAETKTAWRNLFVSYTPLTGEDPSDFLTGYIAG